MKLKITKHVVDKATPDSNDSFIWDSELKGFGLKVTPAGTRVYIVQKRVAGALRRMTIGRHGSPWTPDEARKEALRLLGIVATGQNPTEKKVKDAASMTVASVCDLYLKEGCATKKPSTLATDRGRIARHIKPLLGPKKLDAVNRADVQRFLMDVADGKTKTDERTRKRGRSIVRGGRGAATRTLGLLGAIFKFAVDRGLRQDNPVRGVQRFPDRHNERFLSEEEFSNLGEALADAETEGEYPHGLACIRLLALSGCRRAEVLSLRWEWIDFKHSCLRLPDSKTGAKVVPLGEAATELLRAVPKVTGSPFVFPAVRGGGHFVGVQKLWERLRTKAGLQDVRLHDLRHSFAATGASSGDSLLIIGSLLGHRDAGTTARYAHLSNDPVKSAADRISGQIASVMGGLQKEAANA